MLVAESEESLPQSAHSTMQAVDPLQACTKTLRPSGSMTC
jgi:hypothetical protein